MDRRNFLRTASSFALLATGATTGVSRVFTESPISSLSGNLSDKNTPNADDTMEYRKLGELDVSAILVWVVCQWWDITVGSTTKGYDRSDSPGIRQRCHFSIRRRFMALTPAKSGSAKHSLRFATK